MEQDQRSQVKQCIQGCHNVQSFLPYNLAMMSYEDPMNISNGVTDRGPQPPPPTMSLPPVPSALPNPPSNATATDIVDTSKPPPTRAYSDDPVSREQNDHKSVGRPLSDSQVREPPQQTYGTIPTMSMHEDESKRGSTSLSSYAHNRESALDSLHGFEFVEYAQPLEEDHHSGKRASVQSRDQRQQQQQQPDTMSFAFKEIESMLDGVGHDVDVDSLCIKEKPTDKASSSAAAPEAPIIARTMSPPPIAHNNASPTTSPLHNNAPPMTTSISTPTETPAPREPMVTSPQQYPQDMNNSRPSSSVERAISPSMSKPTRNGSDISDKSNNSNNLRFKPIPNPSYDGPKRPSSTESATAKSPENHVTDMRAPSPAKMAPSPPQPKLQNIPTPGEDEEESEDEFPPLVRPKPREEKWMISSIRRPQQLPVRTQNARIYDRQSTIPTLAVVGMHGTTPPELKIDTSMGQPPQPSAAAGAAHQALETVRAQLQRHASSPTPTDLSATAEQQQAGIRAAPWQQQQQQQQQLSMAPPEPRSDYYSTGGLGRQNSVNGPRPESRQHLTPVPGDDYMIPTSSSSMQQQQPPSQTQPYNVVPPPQASYPPPPQQQQQQQQAPQPKPSQSQNTKEKSGGRFSLAIFGKKRGKEDENVPEVPKMPTSQSEKRQPQQSPLPPPQENRSSMRGNRLSDGMPILGYGKKEVYIYTLERED